MRRLRVECRLLGVSKAEKLVMSTGIIWLSDNHDRDQILPWSAKKTENRLNALTMVWRFCRQHNAQAPALHSQKEASTHAAGQ